MSLKVYKFTPKPRIAILSRVYSTVIFAETKEDAIARMETVYEDHWMEFSPDEWEIASSTPHAGQCIVMEPPSEGNNFDV